MGRRTRETILKMFIMWQLIYKINVSLRWCHIVNLQIYCNVWSFILLDTNQCSFSTSQHHASLSTCNVCFLKLTLLWGQIDCNCSNLDPKADTLSEVSFTSFTRVPDLTSLWSYSPFRSVFISLRADRREQEQDYYISD